ncbi:MAG TPA: hypothetical protein VF763_12690 [Candidatus Limnocylindrales bacterium]
MSPSTPVPTAAGLRLRPAPPGLPDPAIQPPSVAESGDPFAAVRILHLFARLERGRPIRFDEIAAALEATYLDWLFPRRVVVDTALQLQADWMADYRNASGIEVEEGDRGPTLTIEDSSRVDPWLVGQVQRQAAASRQRLLEFSRLERPTGDG